VPLETEKPVFEAKSLILTQAAGRQQGVSAGGRRGGGRWRIGGDWQFWKLECVVVPVKHHHVIVHAHDQGLGSAGEWETDGEPAQLGDGGWSVFGLGGGPGVGVNLGAGGVGEQLRAEADSQDRSIGRYGALQQRDLGGEEGILGLGDIRDAHRPAEDDQRANVVQIRGHFVTLVEVTVIDANSKVPKYRHDSAWAFVPDVLEDNDIAHWAGIFREG